MGVLGFSLEFPAEIWQVLRPDPSLYSGQESTTQGQQASLTRRACWPFISVLTVLDQYFRVLKLGCLTYYFPTSGWWGHPASCSAQDRKGTNPV